MDEPGLLAERLEVVGSQQIHALRTPWQRSMGTVTRVGDREAAVRGEGHEGALFR
jgi:hypothetical protein